MSIRIKAMVAIVVLYCYSGTGNLSIVTGHYYYCFSSYYYYDDYYYY